MLLSSYHLQLFLFTDVHSSSSSDRPRIALLLSLGCHRGLVRPFPLLHSFSLSFSHPSSLKLTLRPIRCSVLCGLFTDNYVLSVRPSSSCSPTSRPASPSIVLTPSSFALDPQIVLVVVLLSMDFWNTRVRPPLSPPASITSTTDSPTAHLWGAERRGAHARRPAVLEPGGRRRGVLLGLRVARRPSPPSFPLAHHIC